MIKLHLSDNELKFVTNWTDKHVSPFEETYLNVWSKKVEENVFRYKLNIKDAKYLEGKFLFYAQLNLDRASNRRVPHTLTSLRQPFNEDLFNFTKLNNNEFMFHVSYKEKETGSENTGNYIVINNSPLEFGHCLLLPSLFDRLPQVLTYESIEFAVTTLLANYNPAFRIGFNGLCGYASVNHLHFHAYYLHQTMLLEYIDVDYLISNCYVLERYPSKGYVFQITSFEVVIPILKDIYSLTKMFMDNDVPHNMYLTRGVSFKKAKCSEPPKERDCVRIYIWARTKSSDMKMLQEFNPAMCELFGHLLLKTEESYSRLTEDYVAGILFSLTEGPFNATKEKVRALFQN